MAPSLVTLTPMRPEQQLSFDTASLNGSSSPTEPSLSPSPRKFTFTPQPTKTFPRAWERRPATPYLARNDAQKIWKRVPLGSITSNTSNSWNKADRGPLTRPVKKLRTLQLDEDEDKENIDYIASKWDEDRKDSISPKRKVTGFTAINREETTACYVRETTITMKDPSTSTLGDGVATDSDFTEDEGLKGSYGELEPPSSVHVANCDSSGMDSLSGEEHDSQSTDSTFETVYGSSAPGINTAMDASLLAQQHSDASELHASAAIPMAAEGPVVPAPNETGNAVLAGEDDTAFLHDFLSRARAQKAARQQPEVNENQQQIPDAMDIEESPKHASLIEDTDDIDGRGSHPESGTATLQPDVQAETNQLSPCRRSSRLNTRLPRLQKSSTTLPSSIALKRLTGTEFISQKETQSVALMTRSNTKRNKGVAKSVQERLIQLDAEAKARDPTAIPVENGKKRRRKAKEVTWAVQLTMFQDDTPVLWPTEEQTQADFSVALDTVEKENLPASTLEPEDTKIEEEKKQVRKVRKLRKLNVGTYNGTPAPKKTISLPVPVTPTFALENCKPTPSATTSEIVPDNANQPEVKTDPSAVPTKPKTSTAGSEKRFQTRMRTRNRT